MNERIRELAEQAGLPIIDGEWDYNDREILRQVDDEWRVATPAEIISVLFACEKGKEKFADLIVRECGILADQYRFEKKNPNPLATERLPLLPSDFIYEHFGV